jgi:hypothetical protein
VKKREALGAGGMLALQAAAGNRAVAGLVQAKRDPSITSDSARVHEAARLGIGGGSGKLPYLGTIQKAFGRHDVTGVAAHTGAQATAGAQAMGAAAFTTGNHVAFAGSPDLHTAAHEAAHVVQQRGGVQLSGGVGVEGDRYEQHADAVAGLVVQGRSAERLLDQHGVPGTPGSSSMREDSPGSIQQVKAYRVQDDDKKRKRMEVDADGNVTINSGPLNISIGSPDHALYFLSLKGLFDIVEFGIDDTFYKELAGALQSQSAKNRPRDAPTYNDPGKPGYKIEIPEGQWLERLKGKVTPGSGQVTKGAIFAERESGAAYSKAAVSDLFKTIFAYKDKVPRNQAKKSLKAYGLEWDGSALQVQDGTDESVDWKSLKEELWTINNSHQDKQLRGVS